MEKGKLFITSITINPPTDDEHNQLTHEEIMALKESNPKKYFSTRIYPFFRDFAKDSEKETRKEIEAEKETRGDRLWIQWLNVEIEKCSNNQSLRAYRSAIKKNTPTPKDAVDYFTNVIAFDPGDQNIDWLYHLDMALHVMSGIQLEKAENWLYKGFFSVYKEGVKVEARQKTLAAYLNNVLEQEEGQQKKRKGRPQSQAYVFENLFVKRDNLDKLLNAALQVGLIENVGNGYKWIEVPGMKSHHVCAFWEVAKEYLIIKKNFRNKHKIVDSIRVFFKMETLAKNTFDTQNPNNPEYKRVMKKLKEELL